MVLMIGKSDSLHGVGVAFQELEEDVVRVEEVRAVVLWVLLDDLVVDENQPLKVLEQGLFVLGDVGAGAAGELRVDEVDIFVVLVQ
jgi:hypothetical protein